uniref:Predicted fibrinogenolytic enzyme 8 n=1 Tax=Tabanus yao TaxID=485572 RepID=C8YJA9_TABYA|nr:predicted fibrinogenolytic enzyme 8 [Tabanus yao]
MASVLALCSLLVVVVLQFSVIDAATDYCKICKDTYGHVGCASPGFGPDCGQNPRTLKLYKKQRRAIMSELNSWRDSVANGSYGLPKAVRMPALSWDAELEYLAKKHTKGCVAETKKRRQTSRFWVPGQINYVYTGKVLKRKLVIREALKAWHSQRSRVTDELVKQYSVNWPKGEVKDFALTVVDRASAIGCSISAWDHQGGTRALLTCNFSSGNTQGSPMYKTGARAGSQCSKKHAVYKSLCTADELINPNLF